MRVGPEAAVVGRLRALAFSSVGDISHAAVGGDLYDG